MYVYADNAATTAMSPAALEATVAAMRDCYGNPSSLHSVGQEAAERLAEARAVMAAGLNATHHVNSLSDPARRRRRTIPGV